MAHVMPLVIGLTVFGTTCANVVTSSRIFFAASRQGHLARVISYVHVDSSVPLVAMVVRCLFSLAFTLVGSVHFLIEVSILLGNVLEAGERSELVPSASFHARRPKTLPSAYRHRRATTPSVSRSGRHDTSPGHGITNGLPAIITLFMFGTTCSQVTLLAVFRECFTASRWGLVAHVTSHLYADSTVPLQPVDARRLSVTFALTGLVNSLTDASIWLVDVLQAASVQSPFLLRHSLRDIVRPYLVPSVIAEWRRPVHVLLQTLSPSLRLGSRCFNTL
ncbi:hypothetical protein MRX96_024240 [Rhipicephalus microplus]